MMLLSVGDKIQQGTYQIHSKFDRVVNFIKNGNLVSLVDKKIGGGPLNIVISGVNFDEVHALEVKQEAVVLNQINLDFREDLYYRSDIDYRQWDFPRLRENLYIFEKLLIQLSHPMSLAFLLDESRIENFREGFERAFVDQIASGVKKINNKDIINGVKMLKGCGFGLTPSGDDFIAGLLIGMNLIHKMTGRDFGDLIRNIYEVSKGENIFSNTFLQLARDGLLFEKMKKLLSAILYKGENEILHCIVIVFSIGESSGADLCTGFLLTVQSGFSSNPYKRAYLN